MFMQALINIKSISEKLDKIAARVILPFFCFLISFDVLLRYFFSSPISWSTEINGILLLTFFMLAMPRCCASGGHVSLDLLYNRLGPRRRAFSDLATAIAGLVLSLAITYGAYFAIFRAIRTDDALIMVDIPKWPLATFIALIALFLTVQFLLQAIIKFEAMINGEDE